MRRIDSTNTAGRLRRFWPALLGALVVLGLVTPGLALAQTLTGTFAGKGTGREVAFQHNGKAHNDWAGVLRLKLDNGAEIPVFCIQIEVRVRTGDRYRSDGAVLALPNGCQIRYLLDKYPASSAKSADEAAARQLAIWVFSDGVDPATIQDAGIRDRVSALVNEAKQGPCPTRRTEGPDLSLAPPNANAAAGQTVAYTVQASAEDAGHPATVSVAGPAILTDANGASTGGQQQQVTLDAQGQAHFWVTGTGAGAITVRVDLPYQLSAGTVFSHLDNGAPTQRLVMAETRNLTANAAAQMAVAGAPQPSPTGPAPAPQPSPTAGQPAEQATPVPTQAASAPTATPTHKPSHRTHTPTPAEQPSATVISETQATAAPTPPANTSPSDTTATPVTAPDTSGQAPPSDQAAAAQTATAQAVAAAQAAAAQAPTLAPAGGAAGPRPRSLPNTGASNATPYWLLAPIALLLALGGWLIRRRI